MVMPQTNMMLVTLSLIHFSQHMTTISFRTMAMIITTLTRTTSLNMLQASGLIVPRIPVVAKARLIDRLCNDTNIELLEFKRRYAQVVIIY